MAGSAVGTAAFLLLAGSSVPAQAQDEGSPAAVVHVSSPIPMDASEAAWSSITAEERIQGRLAQAGSFKLAYDSTSIYALVHVIDGHPVRNSGSVFQELFKTGEAISLCFGPSASGGTYQRIMMAHTRTGDVIFAMRPTWPGRPHPYKYFTTAGGTTAMDDVERIEPDGAKVVYKLAPDGYIAEVKIPLAVLGYSPQAGLRFPFDAQIISSDPAGTINVDTAWWHSVGTGPNCTTDAATEARLYPTLWGWAQMYAVDPGPPPEAQSKATQNPAFTPRGLPITFTLPRDCKVSVLILTPNGWVVRELLRAESMSAGEHTIWWDGRDRWGAIEPPGKYTYRLAYFDGIKATFAASVGNCGIPPWRTADGLGSIGGMHNGPGKVMTDSTGLIMANGGEEGQMAIRKINTTTLKSIWFHSAGGFGGGGADATDGTYDYLTYGDMNGAHFVRVDPATGANEPIGGKSEPIAIGNGNYGVAVLGGTAYIAFPAMNEIHTINLTTGAFGAPIPVQSPTDICVDSGSLLVCSLGSAVKFDPSGEWTSTNAGSSAGSVVKLDPASGRMTTVIDGLDCPSAVTVDSSGRIYVSEMGKTNQIKRFDPDGRLQLTIGVLGGRHMPAVPYNPLAFLKIVSLAIGPEGNLWAAEEDITPRRYIEMTQDGKWIRDVYGPNDCGATVGFDQDDFSSIWFESSGNLYENATVDYAAYAKAPDPFKGYKVNSIWQMTQSGTETPAVPDLMGGPAGPGGNAYNRCFVFTATNGKRYFWGVKATRACLWLWENGRWKPAVSIDGHDWADPNKYWTDKNGDGLVQSNELSSDKVPITEFHWIDRNLTLYGLEGSMKPASIDARGVPNYDGGKFTPYFAPNSPLQLYGSLYSDPTWMWSMAPSTSDDSAFLAVDNGPREGKAFWDLCSENRLIKMQGGKVQWIVGHHDGGLVHDGDSSLFTGVAGEVDGVVIVSDVEAEYEAYTTDGIPLGWVLTGPNGRRPDVGPNAIYVENAAPGEFMKDPKTGRRLLITMTSEDIRVLNITGVFGSDIVRVDGPLTLESSEPRESAATNGVTALPYRTWVNSIYENNRGTNVDGFDYEWAPDSPALEIRKNGAITAEVRLRRDAGRLCVFADVIEPNAFSYFSPASKSARPFGTGDGVELDLGPYNGAPHTSAGPGDTRIYLTAAYDSDRSKSDTNGLVGMALACKPASAPVGASQELSAQNTVGVYADAGTTAPTDFSQGLIPIPGAQVCVRRRYDGNGYIIEAEIPIAAMPEISQVKPVSFFHADAHASSGIMKTDNRSDLILPLRINAAVWESTATGDATRIAWIDDGYSGKDPMAMAPARWGMAGEPPSVAIATGNPASEQFQTGVRYLSTESREHHWQVQDRVTVTSSLFGGKWATTTSALSFVTSPAPVGFSIDCAAAGGDVHTVNSDDHMATLDMTEVGIPYADRDAQLATDSQPVKATVQYTFAPGQSGTLHVLWGGYMASNVTSVSLSVTGGNGQTFDDRAYPDLAYIGPNETRDSTFELTGRGAVSISVSSHNGQPAYLQAIWIEPVDISGFAAGQKISVAAYPAASSAGVDHVDFYVDGVLVGSSSKSPYACELTLPKPGITTFTAKVTDLMGATAMSSPVNVRVSGE